MKAKKPLLLTLLILILLVAAMILPAVASAAGSEGPTAWANWARSGKYTEIQIPLPGGIWMSVPVSWDAAFAVHVEEGSNETGGRDAAGHEVMNWQSEFDTVGTGTPPYKHNRTTYIVDWRFDDLGGDAYRATVVFRFDMLELGWPPRYLGRGDLYHTWILTDNPGDQMDHVALHTWVGVGGPDIEADPHSWGGWKALDLDCRGVQVVMK